MIIGNKTLSTRYILPFLFEEKELFCDKYCFVNAYIGDINRPYLDNHIFLLFEYNTEVYDKVNNTIKSNKYYFDTKFITIDNILYLEYIFVIPPINAEAIKVIKDGYYTNLSSETKLIIISFWKDYNLSYLSKLLNEPSSDLLSYTSLEEAGELIKEEDINDDPKRTYLILQLA